MANEAASPRTLGEKLAQNAPKKPFRFSLKLTVSLLVGLGVWRGLDSPELGLGAMGVSFIILTVWFFSRRQNEHILTAHDSQGFVGSLNLDEKTAVFDGSNIYHFGLDRKVGRMALGAMAAALRSEGYRIVCFFDANIYFTLRENGALTQNSRKFSPHMLQEIFELKPTEIYVVPSGNQADVYVIEAIKNLPKSFAVTNDRFRDYHAQHSFLATDKHWRKGVKMQGRNLVLYQHKFKFPLVI